MATRFEDGPAWGKRRALGRRIVLSRHAVFDTDSGVERRSSQSFQSPVPRANHLLRSRIAQMVDLDSRCYAGAAHEMATPLATIAVTAKEMEHDATVRLRDHRSQEDAQLIRSQVERCRSILERMGTQGADPFGETPKSTELDALLLQVKEKFPEAQSRIHLCIDEGLSNCLIPVRAAVEALSALVKNALDASPHGKPVVVRAVKVDEGRVRFVIRDEGTGMSPEVMERRAVLYNETVR